MGLIVLRYTLSKRWPDMQNEVHVEQLPVVMSYQDHNSLMWTILWRHIFCVSGEGRGFIKKIVPSEGGGVRAPNRAFTVYIEPVQALARHAEWLSCGTIAWHYAIQSHRVEPRYFELGSFEASLFRTSVLWDFEIEGFDCMSLNVYHSLGSTQLAKLPLGLREKHCCCGLFKQNA